jgi:hypothetical protein
LVEGDGVSAWTTPSSVLGVANARRFEAIKRRKVPLARMIWLPNCSCWPFAEVEWDLKRRAGPNTERTNGCGPTHSARRPLRPSRLKVGTLLLVDRAA